MKDIMDFISLFLSKSWEFFKIDVPGTNFSFGVVLVGLAIVGIGFRFLSIMLGHNIGEVDSPSIFSAPIVPMNAPYNSRGLPAHHKISPARLHDVR